MLFNTEEKNMMIGALTAGGLQALMDGYFGYKMAGGVNPAQDPSDPMNWLFAPLFTFWLPNLSQLIPWLVVPGVLYYVGKRKRNSRMRSMGVGGLVYGVSELISTTTFKAIGAGTGNTFKVVGGVVR